MRCLLGAAVFQFIILLMFCFAHILAQSCYTQATKPGGVFTVIGHGRPDISIPMVNTVAKEIDIRGSFRYCNE